MNGFRINERTDQMRRERIAHQQSNQQNSTRLISKFTTTGVNLGKKLWISCPLSWEFSIPVLAGLIPRERFHRRKKGRCFHQKHCPEISSLSPKFTTKKGKNSHESAYCWSEWSSGYPSDPCPHRGRTRSSWLGPFP